MNNAKKFFAKPPCGLLRRMAAILYDCLLLFAVFFAVTAILLPLTNGNAIQSENLLYFLYLIGWSFLFFGWQWTHGGQTLGMRAWKVKLLDMNQKPVNWLQSTKRFFLALFSWSFVGLGFAWAIFDPEKLAFHDRFSGTKLYKIN